MLYSIQIFLYSHPLAQIPAPTAQLERAHSSLQLGSQTASSINARTLAGRPILRSRLADASTASFAHRFDCTPPIPAPAAFSAVRHSTFSASPNLTIAAGRRKLQGAAASALRPGSHQERSKAASSSVLSSQHASLLFVSILSQSNQLQIFFILSEFQFPSI